MAKPPPAFLAKAMPKGAPKKAAPAKAAVKGPAKKAAPFAKKK